MCLYSVFDVVAESWSPPFLQENDRSADRSFQQLLRQHPESAADMRLFCLGLWDPKDLSGPLIGIVGGALEVTAASIMKELENAQS